MKTAVWRSARKHLPERDLLLNIGKGLTFQTVANVMSQAGSFLGLLIVARVLGKAEYGKFALVQSTVYAFTNLAALGLGITATKYVSQFRTADPPKAGRILALSSVSASVAAVVFAVAYYLACPS